MLILPTAPMSVYTNEAQGIEASIYFHVDGFSVSLKDADAGETLPTVKIFPTVDEASRYARNLVFPGVFDKA